MLFLFSVTIHVIIDCHNTTVNVRRSDAELRHEARGRLYTKIHFTARFTEIFFISLHIFCQCRAELVSRKAFANKILSGGLWPYLPCNI